MSILNTEKDIRTQEEREASFSRFTHKLDTLRKVLSERGASDSKETLEAIAENISAAFDKIKL
ncbi:hypothetical protein FHC77_08235 [Atlantibacter hermannii]|uniref:hypothetical protein n=1 Tax=Atlantibacter hermannii TaxID=565 RepID=UPI001C70A83B|nr:hypothetical protein [Atlantibacter hermannii]MBW9430732.1 hypothetical protein [Atlantibacter hermannii]